MIGKNVIMALFSKHKMQVYPRVLLIIFSCLKYSFTFAQHEVNTSKNQNNLQYGASLKATFEIGSLKDHREEEKQTNPNFKLVVNFGIGSNYISSNIYPTLNTELQFYNGGIGSKNRGSFFHSRLALDFISALTITAGINNVFRQDNLSALQERNVPLYYFSDFAYPALQNPFLYSLSLGTNFIVTTDKNKTSQRIGFINIHADRGQFSYYNDGGPGISDICLGDRKDRYYTGGGVFSYHGKRNEPINIVEVSYHKFTGYTLNAFELSNKLFFNFMSYKREDQEYYNKSLLSINIGVIQKGPNNYRSGLSFTYKLYTPIILDFQHKIHWVIYNTYHMAPYKPHSAIAINYYLTNSNIGLR